METANTPSVAGTALKAGATFLGTLISGVLLGIVVTALVAALYFYCYGLATGGQQFDPVSHANPVILAIAVLLMKPAVLVYFLMPYYILVYGGLAFFYAWRRALQKVVVAASKLLAERLTTVVVDRIKAAPFTQDNLGHAQQWLSQGTDKLDSLLGDSTWGRRAVRFAVRRLPWSNLLADWVSHSSGLPAEGVLRSTLTQKIADKVGEAVAPSWIPLIIGILAHAALFAIGIYFA